MKAVGTVLRTDNEEAVVIETWLLKYFIPEIIYKSYSKMWMTEPCKGFESELQSIVHVSIRQMLRCHFPLLLR